MHDTWKEGAITHTQENSTFESNNYRPICLTQLIYKIWSEIQTNRIARILHRLTPNNRFWYKQGLSTLDALINLDHVIHMRSKSAKIILAGPPKAFGCVRSRIIWTALYKTGLTISIVKNIKKGRQNTTLRCSDMERMGLQYRQRRGSPGISHMRICNYNISRGRDVGPTRTERQDATAK